MPKPPSVSYLARTFSRPVRSVPRLLTLVQRFSGDYGHFLGELMPRLLLALPTLLADPKMKLLVDTRSPFVVPWLDFVGIDTSRQLLTWRPHDEVVHAAHLAFSRFGESFTPAWRLGLGAVRQGGLRALQAVSLLPQHSRREHPFVLYVSRDVGAAFTAHASRTITDEPAFLSILSTSLERIGVSLRVFKGTAHTASETVAWFSGALAVIGPHGSALHNAIFCSEGTVVVELMPLDNTYAVEWAHAVELGLRYRMVPVRGFLYAGNLTLGQSYTHAIAVALVKLLKTDSRLAG